MNEVHKWLIDLGKYTATFGAPRVKTEGSWVWADEIITAPIWVAALKRAGFKLSTKRGKFFHVSTKFLPGEMAEGLHRDPVPFPVGYVWRKPGPKKGSKRVKTGYMDNLHKGTLALSKPGLSNGEYAELHSNVVDVEALLAAAPP
jgi:hypothetical protein